ncbi:Ldh family oxidoreductase [Aurantimonas sp. 22II-16-19i]|uniref:Ldh family oxidoreductase n=1 Tax=Aurantimonas sp. 22II-16-19i TaxID=1317114 RepID=UPI0009F7B698|nr:Ldh family oxidoreductase [Aurantimonas sp. 22II-16-19i]ORE97844.1 malate dehydrogenase [Aurantimonas sp. 22II-16-19i]
MTTILSIAEAERLVAEAFSRADVGPAQAASVAHALVGAEASGQGGHGLRRVAAYSAQAKAGKVKGHATPEIELTRSAAMRVDAGEGFAYPAFDLAIERAPEIVAQSGVLAIAIRNSHHAGVLGLTVERFAQKGLVALMVANAPGAIAAYGGTRPLFGTNPIAFAAPIPGAPPVVIDLSLSKVARGKVMAAKQKGVPIPEGWALDPDGNPTTDADAALAGTMVPVGDAKGAALALMVEMLAAGLTGANYAYEASSLFDDKGPAPRLGQFILVLDPAAIGGDAALSRLGDLTATMGEEPNVRIPGQRGIAARQKAASEGIVIEDDVMATIEGV